MDAAWTEIERVAYEIKLIRGRPDTGKLAEKIERVKAELSQLDAERLASIMLPPGELADAIAERFDKDEINLLTASFDLEPENLKGERRIDRAFSLVSAMHRQGRIPELVEMLKRERPFFVWPEVG